MNAKNKMIEKLLRIAKKNKILTYPVLALVAIISFFCNLFNTKNGAGKRAIAVVMALVLFVSQSYFMTSSASSLIDNEEDELIQQELQQEEVIDGEHSDANVVDQEEMVSSETQEIETEQQEENKEVSDAPSDDSTVVDIQEQQTTQDDVIDEGDDIEEYTDADSDLNDAEEGPGGQGDGEKQPPENAIDCIFYYCDSPGQASTLLKTTVLPKTQGGNEYDLSAIVNGSQFTSAVSALEQPLEGGKYKVYDTSWFADSSLTTSVNISSIVEDGTEIKVYCKRELSQYRVSVQHKKSDGSGSSFSTQPSYSSSGTDQNGAIMVDIIDDGEKHGNLSLSNISRPGYTLEGILVDSSDGILSNITSSTADIILIGDGEYKTITFVWKPDTYYLDYVVDDNGTTNTQEVSFDGKDVFLDGSDIVVPKDGYKFSGKWEIENTGIEVTGKSAVVTYQNQLYSGNGSIITLNPINEYDGIKMNKTEVSFAYKQFSESGIIQAQYKTVTNSSGANFSYSITDASKVMLGQYGIEVEDLGSAGFQLKTLSTGPLKTTGDSSFTVEVKVSDRNAPEEHLPSQYITVSISKCMISIVPPEGLKTTKEYDGNTKPQFYASGYGTLPTMISETGAAIPDIEVQYDMSQVCYNSPNVAEADRIIFPAGSFHLVAKNGENVNNYILKTDSEEGYSIAGTITPKKVFVIPKVVYTNGRNYVRAGEDDPKFVFTLQNEKDLVGDDDAEWLNQITYKTTRPADLTAERKGSEACQIRSIDTTGVAGGSNYKPVCDTEAASRVTFEVIKEDTVDGTNYSVNGNRKEGNTEWYYGNGNDGITVIPSDGYNTVMISKDGGVNYSVLDKLTELESLNNNMYIYLLSDRSNGGTGAVTRPAKISLKYDSSAPTYVGYTFKQQNGDDVLDYTSGDEIPDGGLYFPGIGAVLDFGTYTKATVQLKVKYDDTVSGLKSLHYGLFNDQPNLEVEFDKATGYATVELLAAAVPKVGLIKCFAEDEAGNISEMIQLSPTGDQDHGYEWSVEGIAPKIDKFVVRGMLEDEQTVIVGSNKEWYNHCNAELSVSDAASGLRSITWHINDMEFTKTYYEKITTSVELTQEINQKVCPSADDNYSVYAVIEDNAGNVITTDVVSFKVDDVPPELTVNYDASVWSKNETVSFEVSDSLSGVNYTKVTDSTGRTIDCNLNKQDESGVYTASFEATQKGEYVVVAVDHAGNVTTWEKDIQRISSEIPECPVITVEPSTPDGENGWYKTAPAVTITNVTKTKDDTPVNTYYQMWLADSNPLNETTITGVSETRKIPSEGVYNIKAWSKSYSEVLCANSQNDIVQVKIDSTAPRITFSTSRGSGSSVLINFKIVDTGSGVDLDTIKVLHGTQDVVSEIKETADGYEGSFVITETGQYSIKATDKAGNEAESAAFTPMSMKIKAVTNISSESATVGANVIKGTFDIESAAISYRKASEENYAEAQAVLTKDDMGNVAVSALLSELEEDTPYVFKITASSVAPTGATAEVLEYEGYFKTLSNSDDGISVTGTARYGNGATGDITVGLFEGKVCVMATEISAGDEFAFNGVEDGNYSIIATDGVYSKTIRLLVEDGKIVYPAGYIDLVLSGKNTAVVITTDDTPNVTADNMDSIFEDDTMNYTNDDAALVEDGGTVEFKLYATLMSVSGVSSGEISAMYAVTDKNKIVGAYLDLSLYKIVTSPDGKVERKRVTELARGASVSVTIPLGDLAGKPGLEVVRIHDTGDRYVGASLSDMDSNPSTYTISTSQFSTYALLYDPVVPQKEPTTQATTQDVTDGTMKPASNGSVVKAEQPDTEEAEPDDEEPKADKKKNNKKENTTKKESGGSASIGSLRSSGSAKTGDAAPVTAVGFVMVISMLGVVVLRRKMK